MHPVKKVALHLAFAFFARQITPSPYSFVFAEVTFLNEFANRVQSIRKMNGRVKSLSEWLVTEGALVLLAKVIIQAVNRNFFPAKKSSAQNVALLFYIAKRAERYLDRQSKRRI